MRVEKFLLVKGGSPKFNLFRLKEKEEKAGENRGYYFIFGIDIIKSI